MEEMLKRLLLGKVYCVWGDLNVDIDPFIIVLDKDGNVVIAQTGNNLAEWKGGSLKISYERAKQTLAGKKIKGGTKIIWLSGQSPNYKRMFLGAIGVSGLGEEREERFVKKMARFRSHYHGCELPIFEGDLVSICVDAEKFFGSCNERQL